MKGGTITGMSIEGPSRDGRSFVLLLRSFFTIVVMSECVLFEQSRCRTLSCLRGL